MKRFLLWFISRLYWITLSLLYKTVRIRSIGEERFQSLQSQGVKVLFGFFHGDYLLLFPRFGRKEVCIFTTESARGALLAEIIGLFGYTPRMIPDKRGTTISLERMTQTIRQGFHSVIVVDGPLGPYHKVKHGIVILAKETGSPIIPIGISSSWRIVLKKRWDRYTLPLPFSRAVIIFGEPLYVPKSADKDEIEVFRLKVENELVHLNRLAQEGLRGQGT